MASSEKQEGEPRGLFGLPWPLATLLITYAVAGIMSYGEFQIQKKEMSELKMQLDQHRLQVGHFGMNAKMSAAETKLGDHERRLDRIESRLFSP